MLHLLSHLPSSTRRRFYRCLTAGILSKRSGLAELAPELEHLVKHYPDLKAEAYLTDKQYRQLTHLGLAFERFLALDHFMNDEQAVLRRSSSALRKIDARHQAKKVVRKAEKRLAQRKDGWQETVLERFLLARDCSNAVPADQAITLEMIDASNDRLDVFFLLHKLQQACRYLAYDRRHNLQHEISFLPAVLQTIENDPKLLDQSVIRLYYYAYRTLAKEKASDQQKLAQLLTDQPDLLNQGQIRELFLVLLNQGVKLVNTGSEDFLLSTFELYQLALQRQLLLKNGKLSGITFMNILFVALKLNRNDWAGDYLATYQHQLSTRDHDLFYPYCLANLHYENQNLVTASDILAAYNPIGTAGSMLYLQGKTTLAKVYYDLEEYDLLDSLLNTISVYISRSKNLGYHGKIYLQFVRLCRRLMGSNYEFNFSQTQKLKADVQELPVKSLRNWLLKRIER